MGTLNLQGTKFPKKLRYIHRFKINAISHILFYI